MYSPKQPFDTCREHRFLLLMRQAASDRCCEIAHSRQLLGDADVCRCLRTCPGRCRVPIPSSAVVLSLLHGMTDFLPGRSPQVCTVGLLRKLTGSSGPVSRRPRLRSLVGTFGNRPISAPTPRDTFSRTRPQSREGLDVHRRQKTGVLARNFPVQVYHRQALLPASHGPRHLRRKATFARPLLTSEHRPW